MTRMKSISGSKKEEKKMPAEQKNIPVIANGNGATTAEILKTLFPQGAIIDFEKLEYSFATPYDGPVEYPLPKAPLAFYVDGKRNPGLPIAKAVDLQGIQLVQSTMVTAVSSRRVEDTQVAQSAPSDSESLMRPSSSEARQEIELSSRLGSSSSRRPYTSANLNSTSEIEGVAIRQQDTSPNVNSTSEIEELSPRRYYHTPSSEGLRSSGLQYSEELSAQGSEDLTPGRPSVMQTSPSGRRRRKSGQCYNCFKGSRLTEKEVCLVCGAKYCANCVLLIMGSMPEGRKCEGCVGRPILEARRPFLGKPSRLLKRLLSPLEIQHCMKSERECPSNQLQPEQVIVNGRALVAEEMTLLLSCIKLKPGRYWYDKRSGLWGQEGEKPCAFITPDLKVAGQIPQNASNGKTQVYLNGREVTKSEMKMFKALGVQCTPQTYLVLDAEGNYGEEGGQKEFKGNIWNKPAMKLLHPFFSFPTPRNNNLKPDFGGSNKVSPTLPLEPKDAPKILLLGDEGSGRSTIFKQTKMLHEGQFTPQEKERYKEMILRKVYYFLYMLLEARERFEEEFSFTDPSESNIYSLDEQLREAADTFLDKFHENRTSSTNILSKNMLPSLLRIWKDPAVKETYKRKDELHMLPDISGDLLNRVLQTEDYMPSEADILMAEGLEQGAGLAKVEFTLEDKDSLSDSNGQESNQRRYQLISIGGLATNEFRKWLDMFEDIKVLVYCVAVSDYDQSYTDLTGTVHNKLVFSRNLFSKIVEYPCFQDTPLVLLLNKYDKFEEKIGKGIPLTCCEWFSDYSPVGSSQHSTKAQQYGQQAYMYVVHKYKRLLEGRRVYTLQLNAQEQKAVCGALEYVQQILKCEEERKSGMWLLHEESIYGDTSTFNIQR